MALGRHRVEPGASGSCDASRSRGAASTCSTRSGRRCSASSSAWRRPSPRAAAGLGAEGARGGRVERPRARDRRRAAAAARGCACRRPLRRWRSSGGTRSAPSFPPGRSVRLGPAADLVALGGGSMVALAARAHADAVAAAAELRGGPGGLRGDRGGARRHDAASASDRAALDPRARGGAAPARARARRARARGRRPREVGK